MFLVSRSLELTSNYVSHRGAEILGDILSKTTTLVDIVLSNTSLNRTKLSSIFSGIAENQQHLFRLDVSSNSLRSDLGASILEAIQKAHADRISNVQLLVASSNGLLGYHATGTCGALACLTGLEVLCLDDNAR